jgi:hypothetical protein
MKLTHVSDYKIYVEDEEEVQKVTFKKFKEEFKLYERSFDMLMETIDCVFNSAEGKLLDSLGKTATVIILPRIVQSIQSIRLLIAKGHYYDYSIIGRSLLESIGLCAHISSNEEEAKRWIDGKPIELASIHLIDLARWLKLGKDSAKIGKDYRAVYGHLCDYVHTNLKGASSLIAEFGKKKKRIGNLNGRMIALKFTPQFEGTEGRSIAIFPIYATLIIQDIFKTELKPYKRRQKKFDRLFNLYLRAHKPK